MQQIFRALFGTDARIYRAPGRVNLIGEHTDYNDGFVMPVAIGFSTWVAAAPRLDRKLVIHSENYSERIEFDLDEPPAKARHHWSDYVYGVAVTLEQSGYGLRGANLFIRGAVPIGAGLSSSAAIEVATGYALLDIAGYTIDRIELAKLCQRAENDFVGLRCGIMDQFVSCCGREGHALLLDCRTLEYRLLPLTRMRNAECGMRNEEFADSTSRPSAANPQSAADPHSTATLHSAFPTPQSSEVRLVICNTMVKHSLASGAYNQRRAECEAGVQHLAQMRPDVRALRDVSLSELKQYGSELPAVVYRRCHHVISENDRVLASAAALEQGDFTAFGRLMTESHQSLRDDYEVSCEELDLLVRLAREVEGVYGARMTGGGFGGCTINLVKAESVSEFEHVVAQGYQRTTGHTPEIYICSAAEGAAQVDEELTS